MEKALSDFSGSVPKVVLEAHHLQRLQRAAFRRSTLHTALAPSSLNEAGCSSSFIAFMGSQARLGYGHNPAQG